MSLKDEIHSVRKKLKTLRSVVKGRGPVLVASHNNPDPDSIVAGVLLKRVFARLGITADVVYCGFVGRAENAAVLDYSGVPMLPLSLVDLDLYSAIALVDTQPGMGNHPFNNAERICAVFDHHRLLAPTRKLPFYDVRTNLGATTTLLYLYASAAGVRITRRIATMMFYALRTETADLGREASLLDREAYNQFYAGADLRAVSSIVNAKVGPDYFQAVYDGIRRSKVYGPLVVTELGELPYPDVVAQIAEYFLRYREASYTFVVGRHGGRLLMSLRADTPDAAMGLLAQHIVRGYGTAGGHDSAAGGQISIEGKSRRKVAAIQETIVRRLLTTLRISRRRPRSLARKH